MSDYVWTFGWRGDALCVGADPELWYPVSDAGPSVAQVAQAKATCYDCPVRGDCAAWALATGQAEGIWGGLTEDDRRELNAMPVRDTAAVAS